MKHLTAVILTALISISFAHAEPASGPESKPASEAVTETEPVNLKCVMADGKQLAFSYIIDLDDKIIKWGLDKYNIVHVSDDYITAYRRTKRVGGEVLVFNRITGDYRRAKIALLSAEGHQLDNSATKDSDKAPEGKLETHLYEGRCPNQKF